MAVLRPNSVLLVAGILILAGCLGGGGGSQEDDEASYQPGYKSFLLYLKPLMKSGDMDMRWELYPGAKVEAWGFAPDQESPATIPGPEIRIREGDTVEITFVIDGAVPMPHTLHWHGIHVPWNQDGVPYLSQAPLGQRQFGGNGAFTYTYVFTVNQSGTYWYHCHLDTQHHVDMGMYGAFIVEPADSDQDPGFDHEATLVLDEWDKSHIHSQVQPDQILARSGDPEETIDALYGQLRDYYHMSTLSTVEQVYDQVRNDPRIPGPIKDFLEQNTPDSALRENRSWYPFTYPAYYADYDTFLFNGRAFPLTSPILGDAGDTIRIRLIHAGNLMHSIHLHGHHFQVTHKDGFLLPNPYWADTLAIAPGERYDVYVKLDNPGAWMLHDHFSQYEQNDHISPGGMATILCYRDGWPLADLCQGDLGQLHGGLHAGDILDGTTEFFRATQRAPVDVAYDHARP